MENSFRCGRLTEVRRAPNVPGPVKTRLILDRENLLGNLRDQKKQSCQSLAFAIVSPNSRTSAIRHQVGFDRICSDESWQYWTAVGQRLCKFGKYQSKPVR